MRVNVRKAVVNHRNSMMTKKNVVGIMSGRERKNGQNTGREAVVVLVKEKLPLAELKFDDLVPKYLTENEEQVPTDVIEVGEIKALHKSKHRPVLPGTSIGHFAITAGTLGVVVNKGGEKRILSNNHVLANENNAGVGDAILQPGPFDGGRVEDKIAELAEFIPISFSDDNLVDAALAKFVDDGTPPEPPTEPPVEDPPAPPPPVERDEDIFEKLFSFIERLIRKFLELIGLRDKKKTVAMMIQEIKQQAIEGVEFLNAPLNLGVTITRETAEVTIGDMVQKSGRTTGVTIDNVLGLDAATDVSYDGGVARFVDQIICGPMSAGGDSGSVVYDKDGNAIGLLFAGSETITILNRIQNVFTALKIDKIA